MRRDEIRGPVTRWSALGAFLSRLAGARWTTTARR
jgi:hypothetical protein